MTDKRQEGANEEELVQPILFGNHLHYEGQEECAQCKAENNAFAALQSKNSLGFEELERRIQKLQVTRAYYQRYPYEGWAWLNELEGAYIDRGTSVFSTLPLDDPEQRMIDEEAATALLGPLTEQQKHVIVKTAEGDEPREIAGDLGHDTSAIVRLRKYEAKRILGVPVQTNMRRKRNE